MLFSGFPLFVNRDTSPVQVKGQWRAKIVTTLPPKYVHHSEDSYECELVAEVPMLAVLFLSGDKVLQFQKFWRSSASLNINISLSFFPYDWNNSSDMQINLYQKATFEGGGLKMAVISELLKQDPRQLVEANDFYAGVIEMGKVIDLAVIRLEHPIIAQFLVVPKSETEKTHGRWRLKKDIVAGLPMHFSFLALGRITGTIPL